MSLSEWVTADRLLEHGAEVDADQPFAFGLRGPLVKCFLGGGHLVV
jgi:hypothetical protein